MTDPSSRLQQESSSLDTEFTTENREAGSLLLPQQSHPTSSGKSALEPSQRKTSVRFVLAMVAHIAALLFCGYIIYVAGPGSTLFSWHPTLMVLAYALTMFEAVLVFSPHSSLVGSLSRQAKVTVHWSLASLAAVLALGGLAVIFQVKENNQKSHFTSWHGLIGLVTVGYSCMQLMGGASVKYYNLTSRFLKMRLVDLKMTHAVSGVAAFTLVTATLMLALYSNWVSERIQGLAWYGSAMAVSWVGLVVVNQVTEAYASRFRPQAGAKN